MYTAGNPEIDCDSKLAKPRINYGTAKCIAANSHVSLLLWIDLKPLSAANIPYDVIMDKPITRPIEWSSNLPMPTFLLLSFRGKLESKVIARN